VFLVRFDQEVSLESVLEKASLLVKRSFFGTKKERIGFVLGDEEDLKAMKDYDRVGPRFPQVEVTLIFYLRLVF
jgi:hypothetical protein